jgi:hypothetical protein
MAAITDLSQELILEIAKYFHGDNKTLGQLSLVSRQFRGPADEISYNAITVQLTGPNCKKHIIPKLVQTLLRRRDLAVRTTAVAIHLTCNSQEWRLDCIQEDESTRTERYSTQERDQLDEHINGLEIALFSHLGSNQSEIENFMSNWQTRIFKGDQRTFVGVLFTLLPKLDTLHISHSYDWWRYYYTYPESHFYGVDDSITHLAFGPVLPALLSLPSNFWNKIKRLTIDHGITTVLTLGLKSLQSLELTLLCDLIDPSAWMTMPSYSHLEELTVFDRCYLSNIEHRLQFLFESLGCYNLLSFTYNCVSMTTDRVIDFNRLLNLLVPMKETLENLRIDICWIKSTPIRERTITPITSLKIFNKLKTLHIFQHAFLVRRYPHPNFEPMPPAAVLPSSLTTLTIIWPTGKVFLWLENLYDDLAEFPNLKKIQLDCRPDFGKPARWFEAENHAVIDGLRQAGIEVSFLDHGSSVIHKDKGTDWWLHEDWFSIFDSKVTSLDDGNLVSHKERESDWWLHENWFSIFDQAPSVTGNRRV